MMNEQEKLLVRKGGISTIKGWNEFLRLVCLWVDGAEGIN